ncbi:hypothetical protein [Rhizosphaericola mali]|uniref:Uncharacterized protein n=1 Tax=Rhizosphaericola mali TaxID=2545455 RepID=A0A5P2G0R8_9BACT|nr:hypothetical protein [Rhizosphaericola mali]QES87432.1 hypothetical protein E0W69_001725 [Rhizosphaericola mali]
MDKREKYSLMAKIVRELEDLKNSQTAVIKKIGQIETDNINLDNKTLTKYLSTIYENVDKNLEGVDDLFTIFSEETEKFKKDNNITDEEPVN